jgi:hypothetical protein
MDNFLKNNNDLIENNKIDHLIILHSINYLDPIYSKNKYFCERFKELKYKLKKNKSLENHLN